MPESADLSKLSYVVKNDVIKKADYDKLAAKVNSIDTSDFVLKTKNGTDRSELENKIPDNSGLVKKTDYDAKITEIEGKILNVTNLATKAALTTVENKIPNVSGLATKPEINAIDAKITNITGLINKVIMIRTLTKLRTIM